MKSLMHLNVRHLTEFVDELWKWDPSKCKQ